MTPYERLGLPNNCPMDDVKKRRNDLLFKWHPDRNPDPQAHSKTQQINAAYQQIKDGFVYVEPRKSPWEAQPGSSPWGAHQEEARRWEREARDIFWRDVEYKSAQKLRERQAKEAEAKRQQAYQSWQDTLQAEKVKEARRQAEFLKKTIEELAALIAIREAEVARQTAQRERDQMLVGRLAQVNTFASGAGAILLNMWLGTPVFATAALLFFSFCIIEFLVAVQLSYKRNKAASNDL